MANEAKKARIAEAALSASAGGGLGKSEPLGARLEQAMNKAVRDALRNGITDPAEILKLKLTARERVKTDARKGVSGSRVG